MKHLPLSLLALLLMSCGESFSEQQLRISSSTDDPVLQLWGAYMVCQKDTDCVIEKGVCEVPVAINKRMRRIFLKKAAKINMTVKCAQRTYDVSTLSTSCETGFCRMSGLAEQLVSTPSEEKMPPNPHKP